MDFESINEQAKRIVQLAHDKKTKRRRVRSQYADAVSDVFDAISHLRRERFGYAFICELLEEEGVLPCGSKPILLRQAFVREVARRKAISGKTEKTSPTNEKKRDIASLKMPQTQGKQSALSGRVVNTGMARILKKSDGSFEVLEDDFTVDK